MKIKMKRMPYEQAMALPRPKHKKPLKPWWILGLVIRILSIPDMLITRFTVKKERMGLVGKQPCLILMNHCSFIDLKIAFKIFFPKPFCIVSTTDSFVGKGLLMRLLGCIPTKKYVTDIRLITDMLYAIRKLNTSVLMYPEAGYTFDGRSSPLPQKFGTLIKKLNVPVVTVITDGAFLRQPLYNNLRTRTVKTFAHVKCLLTVDEIAQKSVEEIDQMIEQAFSFDNFANQYKNQVSIRSPHRAEGLERLLYRCPNCQTEGQTVGSGTKLTCNHCQAVFEMDEYGRMTNTEFAHIPDWYDWERNCVKNDLIQGTYALDTEVEIGLMLDYKALYMVGSGRLVHNENGFTLTGCDGKLNYTQLPQASFSLNADFYWYQIDDIICIGDKNCLYYCFLKNNNVAAKTRLAAEELYKLKQKELK